jgi:rRNA maturation endonuclease Nob1
VDVINMEKYYCENCMIIYKESTICTNCGEKAENKIKIEVQSQREKN